MKRIAVAVVASFIFLHCCGSLIVASAQATSIKHNSNLRRGPSTQSKILTTLPAETQVNIISKYPRSGYVRVQTTAGDQTGWVLERNVAAVSEPQEAPVSTEEKLSAHVTAGKAGNPAVYPDHQRTPGKADSSVTQANIAKNICRKGWSTDEVRPASSVTDKIKVQSMKDYGFTGALGNYELDHLISLQVGGCPDCVENLWPEAYGDAAHSMNEKQRGAWNKAHPGSTDILPGSLEKDVVENHIHDEICRDVPNAKLETATKYPPTVTITLERGQEILAGDWYACYLKIMDGNKPCE